MIKFNVGENFTNVINCEDIGKWEGNVIFEGGTGTGKTYFVLNKFYEYCLKNKLRVLFICNRLQLADEVRLEIKDKGKSNIEVMTYQHIEDRVKNSIEIVGDYDWVVCDEFHHVLEIYDLYTDLSYKWIISHSAQKLFMSATCEGLFNLLIHSGQVKNEQRYYIPKDYSYVDQVIFYTRKSAYLDIIKDKLENTDDKLIYFTNSMIEAIELYEQFKEIATFFCSKWTKDTKAKKLLSENIGKLHNQDFEGRLLITTTALDVGISLSSYAIKHIICNIFDYSQLIQCLGRKRCINKGNHKYIEGLEDSCTYYIRNYPNGQLNIRKSNYLEEMALFKNDRSAFDSKYLNNREFKNPYINYNSMKGEWEINDIAYLKLLENEANLQLMMGWVDKKGNKIIGIGYKEFIIDKLDCPSSIVVDYEGFEQQKQKVILTNYLDGIVGEKLFKNEQKALRNQFEISGLKGKRTLGINTLNGYLKDCNMPYQIVNKQTSIRVSGKVKSKRYWQVIKEKDD
ncbi:DEAD/DEAH box helicase family protein [Solibacillus daqui]|uniref:DEAD/DEAH box helicase family protein n=1 Tax=Solibacillus daqui TaxID=2912187 RepID=UPI002365F439|nr:DEAD/DEAH box helicase family protein [Solibacillus daqui]